MPIISLPESKYYEENKGTNSDESKARPDFHILSYAPVDELKRLREFDNLYMDRYGIHAFDNIEEFDKLNDDNVK